MNIHGYTEDEVADILARESQREQRHLEWCNDHEGEFTDADGVATMANYDSFWGQS